MSYFESMFFSFLISLWWKLWPIDVSENEYRCYYCDNKGIPCSYLMENNK